jgi:hypothetical protein
MPNGENPPRSNRQESTSDQLVCKQRASLTRPLLVTAATSASVAAATTITTAAAATTAVAATSAAIASATAAITSPAATATAATARRSFARLVDDQRSPAAIRAIERVDGCFELSIVIHLDKPEAARTACFAVAHDFRGRYVAILA